MFSIVSTATWNRKRTADNSETTQIMRDEWGRVSHDHVGLCKRKLWGCTQVLTRQGHNGQWAHLCVAWLKIKYWIIWLRTMKTALEFVILCNNRWLKIEVSTRQKSVFRRCRWLIAHSTLPDCSVSSSLVLPWLMLFICTALPTIVNGRNAMHRSVNFQLL